MQEVQEGSSWQRNGGKTVSEFNNAHPKQTNKQTNKQTKSQVNLKEKKKGKNPKATWGGGGGSK